MKLLKLTESNGRKKAIFLNTNEILSIEESFTTFYKSIIRTSILDANGNTIIYHVSESITEIEKMINKLDK